jgi:hypothetical protein
MFFKKLASFAKLFAICVLLGICCGIIGAFFSKSVILVTNVRQSAPWLLYFLPVAGILTVAIYKLLKVFGMGTNQVIRMLGGICIKTCKGRIDSAARHSEGFLAVKTVECSEEKANASGV